MHNWQYAVAVLQLSRMSKPKTSLWLVYLVKGYLELFPHSITEQNKSLFADSGFSLSEH